MHKLFFLSGSFLTRTKCKVKFGQKRATNIHVSISDQQLAAAVLLQQGQGAALRLHGGHRDHDHLLHRHHPLLQAGISFHAFQADRDPSLILSTASDTPPLLPINWKIFCDNNRLKKSKLTRGPEVGS